MELLEKKSSGTEKLYLGGRGRGGGGGCIWEKDHGNDNINGENEYKGGRTMKMEMMVVTMT